MAQMLIETAELVHEGKLVDIVKDTIKKFKSSALKPKTPKKPDYSTRNDVLNNWGNISKRLKGEGLVPITTDDHPYNEAIYQLKQSYWEKDIPLTALAYSSQKTSMNKHILLTYHESWNPKSEVVIIDVPCYKKSNKNRIYFRRVLQDGIMMYEDAGYVEFKSRDESKTEAVERIFSNIYLV